MNSVIALVGAGEYLPVMEGVDRSSADDPQYVPVLENDHLINFSGGNPRYLLETITGGRMLAAAQKAWARGSVYAGRSAGAIIMGKHVPDTRRMGMGQRDGLGLVAAEYIFSHFDHAGPVRHFVSLLRRRSRDGQTMIGTDENRALVGKSWRDSEGDGPSAGPSA